MSDVAFVSARDTHTLLSFPIYDPIAQLCTVQTPLILMYFTLGSITVTEAPQISALQRERWTDVDAGVDAAILSGSVGSFRPGLVQQRFIGPVCFWTLQHCCYTA